MMASKRTFLPGALLALALGGCFFQNDEPSFAGLDYANVSLAPDTAELQPHHVTLAVGTAVKADISALDSDGKSTRNFELTSLDPKVIDVEPGPTAGSWVFVGVGVGKTTIRVWGDVPAGSVSADVVEQSEN
jgi:hypothetical protein